MPIGATPTIVPLSLLGTPGAPGVGPIGRAGPAAGAGRAGSGRRCWNGLIHHQHRSLELRRGGTLQVKVALGAGLRCIRVLRATVRTEHSSTSLGPTRSRAELRDRAAPGVQKRAKRARFAQHSGSQSRRSRDSCVPSGAARAAARPPLDTRARSQLGLRRFFGLFSRGFRTRFVHCRALDSRAGDPRSPRTAPRCPSL